jgi:membrane-associated phospholipid phosphatase
LPAGAGVAVIAEPFPRWPEFMEAACLAVVGGLPVLRLWTVLDERSRAAARVRRWWQRPQMRRLLLALLAASVLFVTVEDVLDDDPGEFLSGLNVVVRDWSRQARSWPVIRQIASVVSDLTGAGVLGAIAASAVALMIVRRRGEAILLTLGTLSAWALSGVLKLTFGLSRPRPAHVSHAITAYGFPSAHTVVGVVALGLLAWIAGRGTEPSMRRTLYLAAAGVAGVTGAARVVLEAHWLTDVIAGFAAGVLWLNVLLLVASSLGVTSDGEPR